MIRIGICGAAGRMGTAVMRISLDRGHRVAAAFDSPQSPFYGKDIATLLHCPDAGVTVEAISPGALERTDGVIDFSAPAATMELLDAVLAAGKPLVVGTTGLNEEQTARMREAASSIAIVHSPNMSMGVNVLFRLAQTAAKVLSEGFDVEVFEAHHRFKKDAPSGTAKRLIEIIKEASPRLSGAPEVHGREGMGDGRTDSEIGVMAMRGGDIVGEHTVFFNGIGERIELTHRATDRDILARGGVRALEFAVGSGPGLYSMFDVLGI